MKKKDLAAFERQLERLEFEAPAAPSPQEVLRQIVRLPHLWTPEEYSYVQHFHKVYGFNEGNLDGIELDEWSYWHLTALERYMMSPHQLAEALRTLPKTRPDVWLFEPSFYADRKPKGMCVRRGNEVAYDVPSMQRRGWRLITVHLPVGLVMGTNPPLNTFALIEDDPDIVMIFDCPGELDKLTYYLEHREAIHKEHKVRCVEQPLDYQFYTPDAGYSYKWEDGLLIPGSYMDRLLSHRAERRAERQKKLRAKQADLACGSPDQ